MGMTNRGKSPDNVNHPSHYTQGYCETIYEIFDILGPEGFKSYCLGNWIKYKSRAQYKNGDEDLKKAEVYLGWATNGLPPLVEGKRREGDEVRPDYWAEQHSTWMHNLSNSKHDIYKPTSYEPAFIKGDYVVSPHLRCAGSIFSIDVHNDVAVVFCRGVGISVPYCSLRKATQKEIVESKCNQ